MDVVCVFQEDFARMDDFGVYAVFGVNGPPQKLLR